MRSRLRVLCILPLLSCGPAQHGASGGAATFDLDDARQSLVIPPDPEAEAALAQIEATARTGDPRAAWAAAHYLLDLFDEARFQPDAKRRDQARGALFRALDIEPGTGGFTTDLVIEALLLEVDRVLAADRLHAGAQAARTLLEHDKQRPARAELFQRMAAEKGIARGDGPLRANALLRLADFCRAAFRDAAGAATPFRPGILGYCLYPLYDSDPEPYFSVDATTRPPEPAWEDLATGTLALLEQVSASKSRIAGLGSALVAADKQFLEEKHGLWPSHPSPADLELPMISRAAPYEWTPMVRLGNGTGKPSPDLSSALAKVLAADRRGRVAVALSFGAPATAALAGAEAARAAGADTLELLVGYEQMLKAPGGDYWHERTKDGKVARLGVIALSIDTSGGGAAGAQRASDWDPARATLGLHLVLGGDSWQIIAPTGALPAIPASSLPEAAAGLRAQLALLRRAFPDEDGLVLVPEVGASYAALVTAAVAARDDETGRPLYRSLALGSRRPSQSGKPTLAARTDRRAAARVTIVPDALADRVPAVRQCYQDALDRAPALSGTLALEIATPAGAAAPGVVVRSGPKDKALRACVTQSLSPAMLGGKVQTVRVTLEPK